MSSGSPRVLRTLNERAVLELILDSGPLTRGELESLTGLSKAAAAEVLRRLEAAELVKKGDRKPGSAGPAAQMWELDGSSGHVAGVDITPDGVDVAVADLAGQVVGEHRLATAAGHDPVGALADAVAAAARAAGVRPAELAQIVVGMPGVIDVAGDRLESVWQMPSWEHVHELGPLRAALGNERLRMENDVNLVAVEEAARGAAVEAASFALFWLGVGVGSALTIEGRLWRGATGRAGEVGSITVADPAERGRIFGADGGRLDALLSADAILALARAHGLPADTALAAVRSARQAHETAETVRQAHEDLGALAVPHHAFLEALAARVAVGVIAVVGVVDPDLVVLGGPLSVAGGEPLRARVAALLAATTLARTPLALSAVGGNAVRAGALEFALALAREAVFKAGTAGR